MSFLSKILGNSETNQENLLANMPNSIQGFFSTNLSDMAGLDIRFFRKELKSNCGFSLKYIVYLPYYELGFFNSIEITQIYGNTCNLRFFSTNDLFSISPELESFIYYCSSVYGEDFYRKKNVSNYERKHAHDIKRCWINKVEINLCRPEIILYNYDINNLPVPDGVGIPRLGYTIQGLIEQYGMPMAQILIKYDENDLSSYIMAFQLPRKLFIFGEEFDWNSIIGFDYQNNSIVETSPLTIESKRKTSSVIGRAVVGSVIAGPVGAVVGAATSKKNTVIYQKSITKNHYVVYIKTNLIERPIITIDLGFSNANSIGDDFLFAQIQTLFQSIVQSNKV